MSIMHYKCITEHICGEYAAYLNFIWKFEICRVVDSHNKVLCWNNIHSYRVRIIFWCGHTHDMDIFLTEWWCVPTHLLWNYWRILFVFFLFAWPHSVPANSLSQSVPLRKFCGKKIDDSFSKQLSTNWMRSITINWTSIVVSRSVKKYPKSGSIFSQSLSNTSNWWFINFWRE